MARVTQQDIAKVLGVSVMTVSNAFNRPDQLSADLRRRVLDRAAKMGYTGPDATARQLRTGRTNTFAVVFEERLSYAFSDPFSVAWLAAFSAVMEGRRASITLLSVPAGDEDALTSIQDAAVDGVAGLCGDQPGIARARERGLPTVYCTMTRRRGEGVDSVGDFVAIDDYAAGFEVGAHLNRLGHRRVCLLIETAYRGQPSLTEHRLDDLAELADAYAGAGYFDTFHRIQGIVDALGEAELWVVVAGVNSRAAGQAAANLVLDRVDRPTAVAAVSDVLALGFMDACRQRGLRPGDDISVTGFDDLPESEAAGLTTIHQPIQDKGRLAAELLLDPERVDRQIVLPHELIVRSSTRPAA